ncbi:MAG TPA: glycosyltransferase family 4 protein [Candidatus Dormibacteraeota bacterium]
MRDPAPTVLDAAPDSLAGRPIRVLHVLEAIGGGTARHLIDLVRYVPDVQHDSVTPARRVDGLSDDGALAELRAAGCVVHVVPMRRNPAHPANLQAIWRIRRLIQERGFDIVHGHSSVGGAIARLAAAGTGCVRVYTPHALATGALAMRTEQLLRPLTDHMIAVSASEAELAVKLRVIARGRVSVVPNGIESELPTSARDLRSLLGLDPSTPLIGTISRLVPQKAPDQFVRACLEIAKQRPDAHFVLIGDGPLRSSVRAMIGSSADGLRIHHLPDLEKPAWALGALDVFCLTSRFEGGPYTPLEAMRAGIPVVVTDAVGSRDAVEAGVSGVVVPIDDWAAMAKAVLRLLDDSELAARLAAAGRERFNSQFRVQTMGLATRKVYECLVPRPEKQA